MNKNLILLTLVLVISCQTKLVRNVPISEIDRIPTAEIEHPNYQILGMPVTTEEFAYVEEQNKKTRDLLNTVDANLAQKITARASELVPKNAPVRLNYFGFDYGTKDGSIVRYLNDGTDEQLIPAAILPKDAKIIAYRISPDQTKVAFAYSFFGSDWQTWQIFDLVKKELLVKDGEFTFKGFSWPGVSWTPDSQKIVVPKDTSLQEDFKGNRDPKILVHTIGSDRSTDKIIFENFEVPATSRWGAVAVDNNSAIVYRAQGSAVIPIAAFLVNFDKQEIKPVFEPNKYLGNTPGIGILGVRDGKVYFRTAKVGSNFGIIEVDAAQRNSKSMTRVIVPNDPKSTLYQASLIGDKIVTQYIDRDLKIQFKMYDLKGKLVAKMKPSDFDLTDLGHPSIPFTEGDKTSTWAYFTYSSVGLPSVTFKADVVNGKFTRLADTAQVNFDGSKIITEHITYPSHDGKKIQMLIYRRADQANQPAKFAYLYSYGFIGIPNLPQWNRKFQLALELGGIVALPMIRGGGEFGADFQLEGTNARWNTFKDLVYASRWLKKNKSIESQRVIAVGRSFGGMTGAVHYVHNQNEFDLISSIVPVTDWEKAFGLSAWWMGDDFGIKRNTTTGKISNQSVKDLIKLNDQWNPAAHLNKLIGKNLIPGIFFSGQYDTNTTPHQTFSFVKKLQDQFPDQPVYMFQHPNGGHGARAELVDEFLFVAKEFNLSSIDFLVK